MPGADAHGYGGFHRHARADCDINRHAGRVGHTVTNRGPPCNGHAGTDRHTRGFADSIAAQSDGNRRPLTRSSSVPGLFSDHRGMAASVAHAHRSRPAQVWITMCHSPAQRSTLATA